ncbi:hypothetical protein CEXT_760151 [Caerostris extrusa]|uniref:Uncharacterized protein n=1 Tax=Caerostris extrusa TaxID=172846 RepID=A0AAV4UY73_CAEEX|nr:hypothetical protein CEXT_760151 [Caerostris extrusa]
MSSRHSGADQRGHVLVSHPCVALVLQREGAGGGRAAGGPPGVRGLPAAELAVLLERVPDPQRGQPGVPGVPGARHPTRRGHRVRPGGGALGLEAQGAQAPKGYTITKLDLTSPTDIQQPDAQLANTLGNER